MSDSTPANLGPSEEILRLEDVYTHFPVRSKLMKRTVGHVRAVDGVDLVVRRGETVGLVGESGSGKTTLARTIMGLVRPTGGRIILNGRDLATASKRDLWRYRRDMQLVFQNPYGSLNPKMKVGAIVGEPLVTYKIGEQSQLRDRVIDILERVGLNASHASRYPHEFSGGQRQRIGIARALILQPKLLILDEPVSALDVSIQAQVINLLQDLQREMGLTYLIIAHDLAVVRHIAHRVAVMYLGRIVEIGSDDELYDKPAHPYTKALLASVPIPDPDLRSGRGRLVIEGDLPSPINPPSGCRFRTRCWKATTLCSTEVPDLIQRGEIQHPTACHYAVLGDESRTPSKPTG